MNKLQFLLALPWTIEREVRDDDGLYFALTVAELPGFIVAANDEDELDSMFWPALEAFLRSYLEHGEDPPVPVRAQKGFKALREFVQNPVREVEMIEGRVPRVTDRETGSTFFGQSRFEDLELVGV